MYICAYPFTKTPLEEVLTRFTPDVDTPCYPQFVVISLDCVSIMHATGTFLLKKHLPVLMLNFSLRVEMYNALEVCDFWQVCWYISVVCQYVYWLKKALHAFIRKLYLFSLVTSLYETWNEYSYRHIIPLKRAPFMH
jgi:hypothetical protein